MKALHRPSQRAPNGSSFVEILAALSIVGIALLVMLQQLTISYRENNLGQEKVFAYQKEREPGPPAQGPGARH